MTTTVQVRGESDMFQHLETLRRNREKRRHSGEFLVEGVRSLNAALAYGWQVRAFVYAGDRAPSAWAREVMDAGGAATHYALSSALLAKLSEKHAPSELLAVIGTRSDDPDRIPLKPNLRVVVFDRPGSPGNLGSLIRSCDALGADGLIVTGHGADPYDPEVVRASTGSFFALPVVRLPGPRELGRWLAGARAHLGRVQFVGSDESGTVEARLADWRGPTVLALGNETRGMSAAFRELCDVVVRIPMTGSASSLNVACAASILLYELDTGRRTTGRG